MTLASFYPNNEAKTLTQRKKPKFPNRQVRLLVFFVHRPTDEQRDPLIKIPKLVKGT